MSLDPQGFVPENAGLRDKLVKLPLSEVVESVQWSATRIAAGLALSVYHWEFRRNRSGQRHYQLALAHAREAQSHIDLAVVHFERIASEDAGLASSLTAALCLRIARRQAQALRRVSKRMLAAPVGPRRIPSLTTGGVSL